MAARPQLVLTTVKTRLAALHQEVCRLAARLESVGRLQGAEPMDSAAARE